ncbi:MULTISPECIES: DUF7512 family protein [Haloplanus]|jgi:hypothetical protein|nr:MULTISPECIES: hypothetical protein [Haloplanus]
MFGIETLSGNAQAAVLVGLVLVEAAILYLGYGALERLTGLYVVGMLRGK